MRALFSAWLLSVALNMATGLKNPNGHLSVNIRQSAGQTCLVLNNKQGQQLMQVQLGLATTTEDFGEGMAIVSQTGVKKHTEAYTNIHGKQRLVSHRYNQATWTLENGNGAKMDVEVRLFNDGLAFRYRMDDAAQREFTSELTTYQMPAADHRWLQKYKPHYEGDFPYQAEAGMTGKWSYPALFEHRPVSGSQSGQGDKNSTFILLTEANATRKYCVTHLDNNADANQYKVAFPQDWQGNGQGAVNPTWNGSWASPWRVVIVGTLGDVVQSTLVEDVSDPCTLGTDAATLSWIKPGRASWIYWAYNHGTKDFQICKQYVDLAAEMGWEYVLFDWEWDAMTNGGKLEDAVAYALSKGVKPWMWYNSGGTHTGVRATPLDRMLTHKNRMEEFTWLKSMGVVGVKVDFFESDKQNMVDYYLDILEDAAKMQMMVNFHGCTVPRGWSRTYPHLMSQEAVFGAEQYNNGAYMTANGSRINCLLPYTRNVVGPMDYTPVSFTDSQHPHHTSFAHELALSVAFESGVQHWADKPEGFRMLPSAAQQHMKEVPVVWDETRFVGGYPGESFVVARRCGKTWYVAGLNGKDEAAMMFVDLSFLDKGHHRMTVYGDCADGSEFNIQQRDVNGKERLQQHCLPQGGFLLVIK